MSADLSFCYTPLAHSTDIRLAILEPGSSADTIRCRLVDAQHDTALAYEALSYEWGSSSSPDAEIHVNGLRFQIRRNLYDALMHLRTDKDRYLWVDALCINQDDVSERNHQVGLMGSIYSQAERVSVWLGPAKNASDLAITLFEEMNHFMISGGQKGPLLQRMGHWIYLRGSKTLDESIEQPEPELRAILAWAERSFWHRIWIVQEMQLAKQVLFHCGAMSISDSAVMHARMYLDLRYPDQLYDPLHLHADLVKRIKESLAFVLLMRRKEGRIDRRKSTLKDWLYMCKNSLCTDPRDKVYGLLGLATDCPCENLVVDYSKSLHEVYMDVLRLYSARRDEDDLLHFCQFLNINVGSERSLGAHRHISMERQPVWLRGLFSGIITQKKGACRMRYSNEEVAPRNISSPPQILSRLSLLNTDLKIADDKIALLVSGPLGPRIRDVEIDPGSYKITNPLQRLLDDPNPVSYAKHSFMSWGTTEANGVVHWFTSRPLSYKDDIDDKEDAEPTRAHYRGYSGFAPTHAEVGDITCTFPGSNIALVFREDIGCWKLIGRAITVNPFYLPHKKASMMWKGDPNRPLSLSLGSSNAVYLRLELATLWKLSACHGMEMGES